MKVGMIFECAAQGPDLQVCSYLARRLAPDISIEPVTLINKPRLIAECGKNALTLFEQGCARVVIVWDLYPPWGTPTPPCVAQDCERIRQSLRDAGVPLPDVHLVCIVQELEAWLLADERAIAAVLGPRAGRVSRVKHPERISKPKVHLDKVFRTNQSGEYRDYLHGLRIVQKMKDLDPLNDCATFGRFARAVTGETRATERRIREQGPDWPTDPRDILRLPPADRARILREAAAAAPFYRPGAPGMEWADEFVDDLILDADASYQLVVHWP